jgi:hypothetical protein
MSEAFSLSRPLEKHEILEKNWHFLKKVRKNRFYVKFWRFSGFIEKNTRRKRLCFWRDRGLCTFIEKNENLSKFIDILRNFTYFWCFRMSLSKVIRLTHITNKKCFQMIQKMHTLVKWLVARIINLQIQAATNQKQKENRKTVFHSVSVVS